MQTATTRSRSPTTRRPSARSRSRSWCLYAPLKKNNVSGAYRHLLELRGQSELIVGENVTVEVFEPGERIKVSGIAHGKGFAGTIKRHRFHRGPTSHGSHNIRKPGSIGASATPSRVF